MSTRPHLRGRFFRNLTQLRPRVFRIQSTNRLPFRQTTTHHRGKSIQRNLTNFRRNLSTLFLHGTTRMRRVILFFRDQNFLYKGGIIRHRHFLPRSKIEIRLFLRRLQTTSSNIRPFMSLFPPPRHDLHGTSNTLNHETISTLVPSTKHRLPTRTILASLSIRLATRVVQTSRLMIINHMRSTTNISTLLPPFIHLGRSTKHRLVIRVIRVSGVQSGVVRRRPRLLPNLKQVGNLRQMYGLHRLTTTIRVRTTNVNVRPITRAPTLVLRPRVLRLVTRPFRLLSRLRRVNLETTIKMRRFISRRGFRYHASRYVFRRDLRRFATLRPHSGISLLGTLFRRAVSFFFALVTRGHVLYLSNGNLASGLYHRSGNTLGGLAQLGLYRSTMRSYARVPWGRLVVLATVCIYSCLLDILCDFCRGPRYISTFHQVFLPLV